MFYANPSTAAFIAEFYRTRWNSRRERPGKTSHRAAEVQGKIASLAADLALGDRSVPILEIGCGFGGMLAGLQAAGFTELYGTEASPYRAAASALRFPGRIVAGDYAQLPPDRRYGLIYANHVAEHIPDPAATLAWMRDHLAAGGVAAILVPDAWAEPVINQLLFLPHLHSFCHSSLAGMAERLGLVCAFWRGASRPNEICLVAARREGAWRIGSDRFYDLAGSGETPGASQAGRIGGPLVAAMHRRRTDFALHANERHKKKLFDGGGVGQVGLWGRLWASVFTPASNLLPDGKLTRKLQKKLGRSRFVTMRSRAPHGDVPIVGGSGDTLVFHVK